MEIKKTSLNKLHQVNQAKFVEFAGYEMPIQYSSGIIEEHKFTRSNSGIFDVSHMGQLFIYGDDNLTEDLEKIFPLDLKNLKLNSSKYSFLMNDKAGVHDDLIIGEGYTSKYGGSHAEVNAISSVRNKNLLSKSSLYVTLEPCSHFGKTPPCSDLILKYNIPRVYIGINDPNPKVSGKGVKN